jgi:hypothetical protein
VWLVLFFVFLAVLSSAALVTLSWFALSRGPVLTSTGVLVLRVTGDLDEIPVGLVDQIFQERPTVLAAVAAFLL